MESKIAAVPFVEVNKETGEFSVKQEAIDLLKSLKGKELHIVSIVGPYRSGKSFLLNYFAGHQAFTVGDTVQGNR